MNCTNPALNSVMHFNFTKKPICPTFNILYLFLSLSSYFMCATVAVLSSCSLMKSTSHPP